MKAPFNRSKTQIGQSFTFKIGQILQLHYICGHRSLARFAWFSHPGPIIPGMCHFMLPQEG